jgi:hypothetical protein
MGVRPPLEPRPSSSIIKDSPAAQVIMAAVNPAAIVTIDARANGQIVGADVETESSECVIGESVKSIKDDVRMSPASPNCAHRPASAWTFSD